MKKTIVSINNLELVLSNLEKVYWPAEGIRKQELIAYYTAVAPYLLPHLRNRPLTLVRYPDGIEGQFFYQKEIPSHAPEWVNRIEVPGGGNNKSITFVLCNNLATLIWLANLGCIEIHAWASQLDHLEQPDLAVFDLDPAPPATFADALEVALFIREALQQFGLIGYPKTSGATGLHINVPIRPIYTFEQVRKAVEFIVNLLVKIYPQRCTVERMVAKRSGKIYIDFLQNGRSKTMAFVYSLRPKPGAPVSTPVTWEEVRDGIEPARFNMFTVIDRLKQKGDLYAPLLELKGQDLAPIFELC